MDDVERQVAVTFSIEPAEAAGIEWAAPRIVGPRNFMVFIHESGEYELELAFVDMELERARTEAIKLYRRIRKDARLPELRSLVVTGVVRIHVAPGDPSYDYINDAEEFLDQNHHEYAVVAAQIACEVEIRSTFEALALTEPGPVGRNVMHVLRGFTLQDRGSQRLFREAGHPVTGMPWWPAYKEHVNRRHNVVHRGAKLTEADAAVSVDAMWKVVEFMRSVRAAARERPAQP